MEAETSNGLQRRLKYVSECVADRRPATALDVGCGTGSNLTIPLAQAFPALRVLGVDDDEASLRCARAGAPVNATFAASIEATRSAPYDLIIASEVIEHVESPDTFLLYLRGMLAPKGCVFLTLPNGYGPAELTSFLQSLVQFTGVWTPVAQAYQRWRRGTRQPLDSLALSPHVQFLSFGEVKALLHRTGFRIASYRPRTFLAGTGFHQILRSQRLIDWNARVSDWLPPALNSGWMFVLERAEPRSTRTPYQRLRKELDARRARLAPQLNVGK